MIHRLDITGKLQLFKPDCFVLNLSLQYLRYLKAVKTWGEILAVFNPSETFPYTCDMSDSDRKLKHTREAAEPGSFKTHKIEEGLPGGQKHCFLTKQTQVPFITTV